MIDLQNPEWYLKFQEDIESVDTDLYTFTAKAVNEG